MAGGLPCRYHAHDRYINIDAVHVIDYKPEECYIPQNRATVDRIGFAAGLDCGHRTECRGQQIRVRPFAERRARRVRCFLLMGRGIADTWPAIPVGCIEQPLAFGRFAVDSFDLSGLAIDLWSGVHGLLCLRQKDTTTISETIATVAAQNALDAIVYPQPLSNGSLGLRLNRLARIWNIQCTVSVVLNVSSHNGNNELLRLALLNDSSVLSHTSFRGE